MNAEVYSRARLLNRHFGENIPLDLNNFHLSFLSFVFRPPLPGSRYCNREKFLPLMELTQEHSEYRVLR